MGDYAYCCEEDGEKCPEDTPSTCQKLELLLRKSFLEPERINHYENCCKNHGEECAKDVTSDYCDDEKSFLQKDYAYCCEEDGEKCPEDTPSTCQKLELLLRKSFLEPERINHYENCCKIMGKSAHRMLLQIIVMMKSLFFRRTMPTAVRKMERNVLRIRHRHVRNLNFCYAN